MVAKCRHGQCRAAPNFLYSIFLETIMLRRFHNARCFPKVRSVHSTSILSSAKELKRKSVSEVLKTQLQVKKSEYKNWDKDVSPKVSSNYIRRLENVVVPKKTVETRDKLFERVKNSTRKTRVSERDQEDRELQKLVQPTKSPRSAPQNISRKSTKESPTRPGKFFPKIVLDAKIAPNQCSFTQAKDLHPEHIPRLAHGLDRVLFSPGVNFLQDPRTRVYNFTPYLKNIVHHKDFNFDMVGHFASASKDEILLNEAIAQNKKFYSSTSSMTLTLTQFYLFLNNYNSTSESRFPFPRFTRSVENLPLSVIVEPKGVNPETGETIYSVSSDKSADVEILLGAMGHCLEALLTTDEEAFKRYLMKEQGEQEAAETVAKSEVEVQDAPNVYNYSAYGDFLMRSQLDCFDPRLPGNGTFDLKTRAVCAIRYDRGLDASECNYQIWKLHGEFESFEREYNDLIRTAGLLKYGFQARIGQMDGIFVAYHNVNTFFGFQYLPLSVIDREFYSHTKIRSKYERELAQGEVPDQDDMPSYVAETQFKASLNIWQDLMKTAAKDLEALGYKGAFRFVTKRDTKVIPERPRRPKYDKKPDPVSSRPASSRQSAASRPPVHLSQLNVYVVPLKPKEVSELQLFSDKFQTSYKEDITNEQRMENLVANKDELIAFNEKLVQDIPVLAYHVRTQDTFDGQSRKRLHQYPLTTKGTWEISYKIQVIEDGKEQYLQLMESAASMLTSSFQPAHTARAISDGPSLVEQMRMYSAVGKARAESWEKLENPPQKFKSI